MHNNKIYKYLLSPFTSGDPITYYVKGKLKVKNWLATLLIWCLINTPVFIIATLYDLWYIPSVRLGLLEDIGWIGLDSVYVSTTIFCFLWLPDGVRLVISGLLENNIIRLSNKRNIPLLQKYISDFERAFTNQKIFYIVFTLFFPFAFLISARYQATYQTWQNTGQLQFWYMVTFWYFVNALNIFNVTRIIISIVYFNKFFSIFRTDLNILQPSGINILSPLNTFILMLGYIFGLYGLTVIIALLFDSYALTAKIIGIQPNPTYIGSTIIYLSITPFIFLSPIMSAHDAMKSEKKELLLQISRKIDDEIINFKNIIVKNPDESQRIAINIQNLHKLYDTMKDYPVWPFNTSIVVKFYSSVLLPIFIGFLPNIINYLF